MFGNFNYMLKQGFSLKVIKIILFQGSKFESIKKKDTFQEYDERPHVR